MSDYPLTQDAQFSFEGGMNSLTNRVLLPNNQYWAAMNVSRRGGSPQTRPGSRTIYGLPCGPLQGFTTFQTTDGDWFLVAAVQGRIYVSHFPFAYYTQLEGVAFYERAKFVAWCSTVQSLAFDSSGVLYALPTPRRVLMMQDGFGRAAYWDGHTAGHLNPAPSGVNDPTTGAPIVLPDTYGTPIGLWMSWAGQRLWVSRGNQLFASDAGNPLTFSEQTYLNNIPYFVAPGQITGLTQPYQGAPMSVFTATSRSEFQTQITDRSTWNSTPGFQQDFMGIGCVSHRSIVNQFGVTWWYDRGGLVNLNQALQNKIDSYSPYLDDDMAVSKAFLSPDKTVICGCGFEKYLVESVPSGSFKNRHTWVYDSADQPAWDGYWTGWNPVEWGVATIDSQERCFFASQDDDGVNRVWEAFQPDRNDNGMPITCSLETRFYSFPGAQPPEDVEPVFGADNYKQFRWFIVDAEEVFGVTDLLGCVGGLHSAYRKLLNKRMVATTDMLVGNRMVGVNQLIAQYLPQKRFLKSRDYASEDAHNACTECGVESREPDFVDKAFGLLLVWSGRMSIRGLRMFAGTANYNDLKQGDCETPDVGPLSLNSSGCSAPRQDVTTTPLETFSATAQVSLNCVQGAFGNGPQEGQADAQSVISQENAQLLAELRATQRATDILQCS